MRRATAPVTLRRSLALLGSLTLLTASPPLRAAAQPAPDGDEFLVNTYTTSRQSGAAVAGSAGGQFVVVWSGPLQDGSPGSIFGQRFDAGGAAAGAELQANTYTTGNQFGPAVATDGEGGFVVVWSATSGAAGVSARRFDSGGQSAGDEQPVKAGSGATPDVAMLDDGFVVVWADSGADSLDDVLARRLSGDGVAQGDAFRVNTYTMLAQSAPAVAPLVGGGFVVVWTGGAQDGDSNGVFGQRFDASSSPLGTEFQVNAYTSGSQSLPDVATLPDGGFVAVWSSDTQDGDRRGVYGRRYDASGAADGAEFQVNVYTTRDQSEPAVTTTADGHVLVVWQDFSGRDGDATGVFGRHFRPDTVASGDDFQINAYTTASQYGPAVAARGASGFVVTWSSEYQDGSIAGVFGRRYLLPGTTTTTSVPTTTTTLTDLACSQPVSSGPLPLVTDCLFILRTAVGLGTCVPACVCAPNGVLPPSTTSALVCLRKAVGQNVELACPC